MNPGVQKILILLFVMFLGYFLKQRGFLTESDRRTFGKVFTNITFPAVILTNIIAFGGHENLLWLVPLGLVADLIFAGTAMLFYKKRSLEDQAFASINTASVNIGAFTFNFLQYYLTPIQVLALMLFDTGNGIIAFGGTQALGKAILSKGSKDRLKLVAGKLVKSVPLWFYIAMIIFSFFQIKLPAFVQTAAATIGAANPILAMLMIGTMMSFNVPKKKLPEIIRLLVFHYGTVAILAVLCYNLLPFTQDIRSLVVILLFSPLSAAGLVAIDMYNLDNDSSGLLNSISIIIGIIAINVLIPVML